MIDVAVPATLAAQVENGRASSKLGRVAVFLKKGTRTSTSTNGKKLKGKKAANADSREAYINAKLSIPAKYKIGAGGPFDCVLVGLPKGAKQVLMERNLWDTIQHQVKNCQNTQDARKAKVSAIRNANQPGAVPPFVHNSTCCMTGALEHGQDFYIAERNALFNICKEAGHRCFFIPKFHSELNPIERWWAYLKDFCRKNCRFKISELENTIIQGIEVHSKLPEAKSAIKRFFQTSIRYLLLYASGLDSMQAKNEADAISKARRKIIQARCSACIVILNAVAARLRTKGTRNC